jgi:hypothetical protein
MMPFTGKPRRGELRDPAWWLEEHTPEEEKAELERFAAACRYVNRQVRWSQWTMYVAILMISVSASVLIDQVIWRK